MPHKNPTPPRKEYDSDDDFESSFGHLINLGPYANFNYDSDQSDSPDHSEHPIHEEEESPFLLKSILHFNNVSLVKFYYLQKSIKNSH